MFLDFEDFDRNINLMMAKLELEGETCGLKHSKVDPSENHKAVDYLCQNFGDMESGEVKQELRIPICKECTEALYDEDWILCYCVYCHHSQWIYRPYAKMAHPPGNGIYWCDVCPFCAEVEDKYGKNI
jgi:hypothetical protein